MFFFLHVVETYDQETPSGPAAKWGHQRDQPQQLPSSAGTWVLNARRRVMFLGLQLLRWETSVPLEENNKLHVMSHHSSLTVSNSYCSPVCCIQVLPAVNHKYAFRGHRSHGKNFDDSDCLKFKAQLLMDCYDCPLGAGLDAPNQQLSPPTDHD